MSRLPGLTTVAALLIFTVPWTLHAQSQLIFPRLSFEEGAINGLAIVNPSDQMASVRFTAYGTDGISIRMDGFQNPVTRFVPAGQQLSEVAETLFGGRLAPDRVAWVEASSSVSDLTGFFLALDGEVSFFDGADLPVASEEIVFADIRVTGGFASEVNLVNPGFIALSVDLSLVRATGRVIRTVDLPARGLARFDVADLFAVAGPAGPIDSPGYLVISSPQPIAGFSLLRGPGDALGLNAQPASEQLNRLYFPQLAVLDPFITEMTVLNQSTETVLATITAHRPDGALYGPDNLTTNPVVRALEPGQLLKEDVETLFGFSGDETLEGWLEVSSTSRSLAGSISYSIPATNSIAAVASVARGNRRAVFSHIATTIGFFTGIAMLNPGTLIANVRVVAVEPDGTVIGSFSTTLRPGQRISELLSNLIPAAADRGGGLIWVSSDIPIYLTSLFGNSTGVLANIPPQPVPMEYRPDQGPTLMVDPPLAVLSPGGSQGFGVVGASEGMNWSVNGVSGGDSVVGMVDAMGNYMAPASVPTPLPVTITTQAQNQVSGASIDVISRRTLISGLGVVQSVAYLEGLDRLFAAELVLAPSSAKAGTSPSQNEMSLISDVSSGTAEPVVGLDDDISKMVAFSGIDGQEYLLLAGRTSGTVRRLNPQTMEMTEVVTELNAPTSMVIDPLTGSLLIAESDRVTSVPEGLLNSGIVVPESLSAAEWGDDTPRVYPRGTIDEIAPRGISIDTCTGDILVADFITQSILAIDRLTGERRILISGLSDPGQLLGLLRSGVPCPSAFHLFVVEEAADQLTLAIPSQGTATPWAVATGVLDVALAVGGEGAEIATSSGVGELLLSEVPGLYSGTAPNPDVPAGAESCVGTVSFADASVEAEVRSQLALSPAEPITCAAAATVTNLRVQPSGVSDLAGLEALTSLARLTLFGNNISDLGPLEGLRRLVFLSAPDNQISDLSPLSRLTRMQTLVVFQNQISSIEPLANMRDLRILSMSSNQVSDLSPLSGLTELFSISASRNPISDLTPLRGKGKLVSVEVFEAALTSLDGVENLTALTDLNVSQNQIQSIEPLEGRSSLLRLFLGENQITDISVLSGMTEMTFLSMSGNQITDIGAVAGLTELTNLQFDRNLVADVSALSGLSKVTNVFMSNNQIGDISSVAGLAALIQLAATDNQISDVSPLAGLSALSSLILDRNQISDISALSSVPLLRTLNASENPFSDLSALQDLAELVNVVVRSTLVADISPLVANLNIGQGDFVSLSGTLLDVNDCSDIQALLDRGVTVQDSVNCP